MIKNQLYHQIPQQTFILGHSKFNISNKNISNKNITCNFPQFISNKGVPCILIYKLLKNCTLDLVTKIFNKYREIRSSSQINYYQHTLTIIPHRNNTIRKMQPIKVEEPELPSEVKVDEYDVDVDDSEDDDLERTRVSYEVQLINACKKGDIDLVEKCINRKANINYQDGKMKWTPLVWAACKGHLNIVKFLLSKGAGDQYINIDANNRQIIMGTIKEVRATPLQWACFKGHMDIFLVLLKAGLHWQDIDQFGNNSVNLAAAGNNAQIFKILLQYGVLANVKNSRGHSVKQLSTNKQILELQKQWSQSQVCFASKIPFKIYQIKYWCWICGNFFKKENFNVQWVLKTAKDEEANMVDGRCTSCWNNLDVHTQEVQKAIHKYDEQFLTATLKAKKQANIKFEVKFIEKAYKIQEKLIKQNQILKYINSLSKVPNYKIILKAVDKIECMLKEAEDKKIELDQNALEVINKEKDRLVAQRNLRYMTDNIDTSTTTRSDVAQLESLYSTAENKKVASEYLESAGSLKQKMARSILAQDLYQMFIQYPQRPDPYPDPLIIDPKTKRPLDPVTKKPTDPMNLVPKKKKGKKQPKFLIPEWANDLKAMNEKIKELQDLLKMQEQLNLSQQLVKKCSGAVTLMKRQSRYRKDMGQLQKMVDQIIAKQKKAAG